VLAATLKEAPLMTLVRMLNRRVCPKEITGRKIHIQEAREQMAFRKRIF